MTDFVQPLLMRLGLSRRVEVVAGPVLGAGSRFYPRYAARGGVELFWPDHEGFGDRIKAAAIDISELGLLVESRFPVDAGADVFVVSDRLKVMGPALVRHCTARGTKFRIGLEFRNPLRTLPA